MINQWVVPISFYNIQGRQPSMLQIGTGIDWNGLTNEKLNLSSEQDAPQTFAMNRTSPRKSDGCYTKLLWKAPVCTHKERETVEQTWEGSLQIPSLRREFVVEHVKALSASWKIKFWTIEKSIRRNNGSGRLLLNKISGKSSQPRRSRMLPRKEKRRETAVAQHRESKHSQLISDDGIEN